LLRGGVESIDFSHPDKLFVKLLIWEVEPLAIDALSETFVLHKHKHICIKMSVDQIDAKNVF
jgi:hypothetical protein